MILVLKQGIGEEEVDHIRHRDFLYHRTLSGLRYALLHPDHAAGLHRIQTGKDSHPAYVKTSPGRAAGRLSHLAALVLDSLLCTQSGIQQLLRARAGHRYRLALLAPRLLAIML